MWVVKPKHRLGGGVGEGMAFEHFLLRPGVKVIASKKNPKLKCHLLNTWKLHFISSDKILGPRKLRVTTTN